MLFVMCLSTEFTIAEEGPYQSAISSEPEMLASSIVNTSSGVEGDLKTSYLSGHFFSIIRQYAIRAPVRIIDSATRRTHFSVCFAIFSVCLAI